VNTTLEGWAKDQNLSLADRLRMPLLVRANKCGEWSLGNVVLIARMYAEPYAYYANVGDVSTMFRRAGPLSVPTIQAIFDQILIITNRMQEACDAENKRREEAEAVANEVDSPGMSKVQR
jgi:hypothetical protein